MMPENVITYHIINIMELFCEADPALALSKPRNGSPSASRAPAGHRGLLFRVSIGEHPNARRYLRLKSAM